jgi:hypothetical protein
MLKGTLTGDFRLLVFFHQATPGRALIYGLKPFKYSFEFTVKIDKVGCTMHSCVNNSAEHVTSVSREVFWEVPKNRAVWL